MVSTHAHSKNGLGTRRPGQKLNKLKNIWNNISPAGCRISESFRVEYHRNIFIDLATSTSDLLHPPVLGYLEVSIVTGVPQKKMVYEGKSQCKMDDYPYDSKNPPSWDRLFFSETLRNSAVRPLEIGNDGSAWADALKPPVQWEVMMTPPWPIPRTNQVSQVR